jgi:hypothetical protein
VGDEVDGCHLVDIEASVCTKLHDDTFLMAYSSFFSPSGFPYLNCLCLNMYQTTRRHISESLLRASRVSEIHPLQNVCAIIHHNIQLSSIAAICL